VTSPPQAYPVTSIAIDPTNTNILYASTGEYVGGSRQPGIGVLKSVNGGNSWYVTNGPMGTNFLWLGKIIINPLDSDILYVVGSARDADQSNGRGTVFRSDDQGENWSVLWTENIAPLSTHIFDIEINPTDTSELIIGTFLQVLISDDSGVSWTSLMGSAPLITTGMNLRGNRCEVAYCSSAPANIYVQRYIIDTSQAPDLPITELWRSTNGGSNWTLLTSTSGTDPAINILKDQGSYDNTLWVDPSNCSRAIMGGVNLWKWSSSTLTRISEWSDDIDGNAIGGNNSAHADQHIIIPDPDYDGSGNTRVYFGNDGGIYKAENAWTVSLNSGWAALNSELNITQMYGVDVSRTGDTLIGGAQDNSYFVDRTANSGDLGWGVYSTGDGGHCAIKKSNPEIMYGSTQRGNVFKSADGGDTFCRVLSLNGGSTLQCGNFFTVQDTPVFIAPIEMDPNNDQTLYVGGRSLWRTQNEGTSWSSLFTNTTASISTIEIAKGNANLIWIGLTNGNIWRTVNGGVSWSQISWANQPAGNAVSDIAINPNNTSEVFVTLSRGFQDSCIWYTSNAGSFWELRDLGIQLGVHSIVWHPLYTNWVYCGTAYGLFASEDDGQNWSITPFFSQGEGPVYAPVLELVWQGEGTTAHPYYLVSGTYGRGVWRTRAPIFSKYYVDKNCSPCGLGTFSKPFATFKEAIAAAGSGTEIVFLSGGTYNEIPADIFKKDRIKITLSPDAASSAVIE